MPRVLLVDDETDSATPIELMLRKRGYEVEVASNGEAALFSILHGVTPDVIILDMQMPVMDGLQFLDNFRSFSKYAALPVVVISALLPWSAPDLAPYNVASVFTKGSVDFGVLARTIDLLTGPPQPSAESA